jgi:glycosyl transferase family 10 (putative fucosyltransferase)
MIIKIVRYFKYPDLKRQTPFQSFKWKDFIFTEEDIDECDYLVILDHPKDDFSIKVHKDNVLHLCLEPANEVSKYRQYANKNVKLIFNQLDIKKNNVLSHGALPWHLDKDYDFLNELKSNSLEKQNKITWITSNQRTSKGHVKRMDFLDSIKEMPFVDLYGRGINPIDDKWEVLSKYKYAIAYENYQSDFYWTEKIADCFLSYTMPLYFGCNKIDNYFPKDSFIQIDPSDKHINLFLKEIVDSKKWENNVEAISQARQLILNEYQLFPFLYNQIKSLDAINGIYKSGKKEQLFFKGKNEYFDNFPLSLGIEKTLLKVKKKLKSL